MEEIKDEDRKEYTSDEKAIPAYATADTEEMESLSRISTASSDISGRARSKW
jgi:hypothetical protein